MNSKRLSIILVLIAPILLISSTITINQLTTPAFATPTEEAWNVYSDNGITFEYPSTWNVEDICEWRRNCSNQSK